MYNNYNSDNINTVCLFSSTLFLLNSAICFIYGFRIYAALFIFLTITSLFFHSNPTSHFANVIDKVAILGVVLYGGYTLCMNWKKYTNVSRMAIIGTFVITVLLFSYGGGKFCFDPEWGNVWHSVLHIISVIGHGMIVVSSDI